MANDCFVTKLKGVVDNPLLPKLGEAFIMVKGGATNMRFSLTTASGHRDNPVKIVSGTGYFTDRNGNHVQEIPVMEGNSGIKTITATSDIIISIMEKYYINSMDLQKAQDSAINSQIIVDAETIKLCSENLNICRGIVVDGDFDIEILDELPTSVIGTNFCISGKGLYGNATFALSALTPEIKYGGGLRNFFQNNQMVGDLSYCPANCDILYTSGNNNVFPWKSTRDSSLAIFGFRDDTNFGDDLDAMLINQANCQTTSVQTESNLKIFVSGNRTSASDSAVATLKTKGYVVKVNGETL